MMNGVGSTWNFLFHQKQPKTCLLPLVLKVDFDDNFKLAPTGFRHLKHK